MQQPPHDGGPTISGTPRDAAPLDHLTEAQPESRPDGHTEKPPVASEGKSRTGPRRKRERRDPAGLYVFEDLLASLVTGDPRPGMTATHNPRQLLPKASTDLIPGDDPFDTPTDQLDPRPIAPQGGGPPAEEPAAVLAELNRADEAALKELVLRGTAVSPNRGLELVVSTLQSMLEHPNLPRSCLAPLLERLQQKFPAEFTGVVTQMARSGHFFQIMNVGTADVYSQQALILRAQLIEELGLVSVYEITILDVALEHWVTARRAQFNASKAKRWSDTAKLIMVAQVSDRLFNSLLQQLKTRNTSRIRAIHVTGATHVAVQVNEAVPPPEDAGARSVVSSARDLSGLGTHDFGKTIGSPRGT